jgi:hypothetical protein
MRNFNNERNERPKRRYNDGGNDRGGYRKSNNNNYTRCGYGNDKPQRNSYNNNRNNTPKTYDSQEDRIKDLINKQTKNLDVLDKVIEFLDEFVDSDKDKVSMAELLNYLNDNNCNAENTKAIAQFNYMLLELANAQHNDYIKADRVNIRVQYIKERFITTYRRELYDRIDNMFVDHSLFRSKED